MKHETLRTLTAYATASLNVDFSPPVGATAAIFYWRISAVAGTTPVADLKLQYEDPTSGQFIDIDGAAFAQKTAASFQALQVSPHLTADSTGDFLAAKAHLSRKMRAVFTFDRAEANETYTATLAVDWLKG